MKKRFTKEQIGKIVYRNSHGETAKELGREIGVSEESTTSYRPAQPRREVKK